MGIREVSVAGRSITIHVRDDTNDPITGRALTGSWLWASSLFLSEWLATQVPTKISLVGKTVLELGAGTGLPGITASVLGASRVILTDVAPLLPGLRLNVEANGLEDKVEVRELKWGVEGEEMLEIGEVDLVLMSDVFYDPEAMEELTMTLKGVIKGEGTTTTTTIWAACEVRGSTGECLEVLVREGFEVEELGMELEESSVFTIYAINFTGSECNAKTATLRPYFSIYNKLRDKVFVLLMNY